uniref:uncharacterized protein LOC120344461 n=1 Tax=Styela clava TaxID=7725 RepID=UPI0019393F0C|nr:uncharacterized protein LOC120344461 [Styela clava]XP_039269629.1 uncharacterized protein LOC120344461 [Styela clava]
MEREFIEGVNARSRFRAKSSILEGFGNDFKEPEKEVVPKLSKTNFFRGGCALDEVEYSVTNERGRLTAKEKKKEVEVQLISIHSHGRYVVFVGGAGSGKTTLVKRYCLLVLDGKVECMKEVEIVHLLNIKDWSLKDGEYTPLEILFSIFNIARDDAVKCGFELLKNIENQKKLLILLDGLDTTPWVLDDDMYHYMITYDQKAPVPVIIYNILCRNLFPHCKILLTSREYGINRFPSEIRPDATIALRGLSRNSIMTLVREIGEDSGDKILELMLKKSLKLMLLCSTPLFLIFVIIVHLSGDDIPEHLSGLIMTILQNHVRSKHLKNKDIKQVLMKLMKLSLDGLKRGVAVFNRNDLINNGINVDDIKDLLISVPTPSQNVVCDQKLLEEDYSFFFVHQTIQELLAACELANLDSLQYEELIDNQIHTSKYGVVRQMLCGLTFNKSTDKMSLVKSTNEEHAQQIAQTKQDYLLQSLQNELKDGNIPPMQMLNLLICLCECGDNEKIVQLVKTNIKKVCLSGIPLTISDLHALGSVTFHCDRLSIMALDNCQLNIHDLKVLSDGLGESPTEITVFDVCFNRSLLKNSMYYLHKICIRGQGLNYWQCGFKQRDILYFDEKEAEESASVVEDATLKDATEEQQIETMLKDQNVLDFSHYNVENYFQTLEKLVEDANKTDSFNVIVTEYEGHYDVSKLCKLLENCKKLGEFKISECEFNEMQLEQIMQTIPEQKIQMVNVFLATDIQPDGWKKIGEITKKYKANSLAVTSCSLTEQKLAKLRLSLGHWKVSRFDLSRNGDMNEICLNQVGGIVKDCETEELIMGYCNLSSGQMEALKVSLCDENGAAKLTKIDLSGNDKLGEDGFKELGKIGNMCKTKELDVSECDPSPQEIRSFKHGVRNAEITKLNVSRNRNMGLWGLYDVGQLVGQCQLKTLFVRQCELEERTLAKFAEGLGVAKIEELDFGLYFMKRRNTTEAERNIFLNLLPNVTKKLTLNAWDFGPKETEFKNRLQAKLNELPFIEPGVQIVFDRGQDVYIQQERTS